MTNPTTPPPELVEQWYDACVLEGAITYDEYKFAAFAAQWGADQELEACCLLLDNGEHAASYGCHNGTSLRAALRPKPSSLKEQAIAALEVIPKLVGFESERDTIRAALEALND
jgi:hypothetical protein